MRFRTRVLAVAAGVISALLIAPGAHAGPLPVEGGQPVYSGGNRCTLGFNVRSGSTYYFLLVAQCGTAGGTWFADPAQTSVLGTVAATTANTSIVRYTDAGVARPGSVHLYPGSQDIVSAGNAYVGQRVCRSGLTTGVRAAPSRR